MAFFRDETQKNAGQEKTGSEAAWWQPAIFVFLKMSAWIAGPVIIALFVGKWLEKKYGTASHWLLILVLVAFFVTMAGMTVVAKRELKKIK